MALSFVQKLLKQYRETGDIKPQNHQCGRHLKLTEEPVISWDELIEKNNDATLEKLARLLTLLR